MTSEDGIADLEAVIREDPYDDGRWMVLEDYLLERDHPCAAIVRHDKAGQREEALAACASLGRLGPHTSAALVTGDWRAGYLVEAQYDAKKSHAHVAHLLAAPAAAVMRSFAINLGAIAGLATTLAALAAAPCRASLRTLGVSGFWDPPRASAPIAAISAAQLAPFALRRLFLTGRAMKLAPGARLDRLHSLALTPSSLDELDAIVVPGALPELRDLGASLRFVTAQDLADAPLRRLLDGGAAPQLEQLQLRDVALPLAAALLAALAGSRLLPQLRGLSLGDTRVAPRDHGRAFAHLEVLALPARLAKP